MQNGIYEPIVYSIKDLDILMNLKLVNKAFRTITTRWITQNTKEVGRDEKSRSKDYISYKMIFGNKFGPWISYYRDCLDSKWHISRIIRFKNDRRHGKSTCYDYDGRPTKVQRYVNGRQNGGQEEYDKFGIIERKSLYRDDKKHGEQLEYNFMGEMIISTMYSEGLKHGKCINFYQNGDIKSVQHFVNGDGADQVCYDKKGKFTGRVHRSDIGR